MLSRLQKRRRVPLAAQLRLKTLKTLVLVEPQNKKKRKLVAPQRHQHHCRQKQQQPLQEMMLQTSQQLHLAGIRQLIEFAQQSSSLL